MTKSAWIAAGIFGVLLVLVLVFALKPKGKAGPELKINGWHQGTADVDKPEQDGPVDKVVITYKGDTITATRDAKNKKLWHLDKPKGARADNYKVRSVLNLFKEPIESSFSSKLSKQDMQAFGFDKDDVIHVTLYKNGTKFVDLDIGAVQKNQSSDMENSSDTWVRLTGKQIAFRIIGKDLRMPFGKDLTRFRSHNVFAFDTKDISSVEITNPTAKDERDRHIVLKATVKKSDKKKGKKEASKSTEKKKTWHIEIPAGYKAGDISGYLSRISGLYAQEFISKPSSKQQIDKTKAYKVKIKLDNGQTRTLWISGQIVKTDNLSDYVKISEYAAKGLRKGLSAFRDKHVWDAPRETISRVEVVTDVTKIVMQRKGNAWEVTQPQKYSLDTTKRDNFLEDLEDLTANDFVAARPINKPYVRCLLTLNDGRKLELVIGPKNKDGKHYARVTGVKDTLVLSDYRVSKLHDVAKRLQKEVKPKPKESKKKKK